MTLFLSIGGIESAIAGTPLESIKTFQSHVERLTGFDMTVLGKQCDLLLGHKQGRQMMKRIVGELNKAALLGSIPDCEAARYSLPYPRLTLGELRSILSKFTLEERRLIVVALATGKSLTECSFLQHDQLKSEANINKWANELRRFVAAIPRHITCRYVFWEFDKRNHPVAMVGFEAKFKQVTKASWSVFASVCDNLIPVDAHEDAKEFATMFVLESVQA